ncbi:MAG TPA: hypothetical protein VF962_07010 [Gemmatimonadaceae bacterium]
MRVSSDEYLRLRLRVHEFLRDVPLYDESAVDLPGGGSGCTLADVRKLESAAPPSFIAKVLYGTRHFVGRMFGWGDRPARPEQLLLSRLS